MTMLITHNHDDEDAGFGTVPSVLIYQLPCACLHNRWRIKRIHLHALGIILCSHR